MYRRTEAGVRFAGLIVVAAGVPGVLGAQEHPLEPHPAEPHTHEAGQALANPVEATSASVARGRQRYVFSCRQCHGNTGKGDGDMSHAGGVPSDFTDAVWQHGESDGEIFLVIRDGVTADMLGYQGQIPDEDMWNLVNYIKSLTGG
jgi:mono/diheme cytochrome c family protein